MQELIARFGNSHLMALSQLRALTTAFTTKAKGMPGTSVPPIPSSILFLVHGSS
jgi:hypothetical protein